MPEHIGSYDVSHLSDETVMALVSTLNQSGDEMSVPERVARDMPTVGTKVTVHFVSDDDRSINIEDLIEELTEELSPPGTAIDDERTILPSFEELRAAVEETDETDETADEGRHIVTQSGRDKKKGESVERGELAASLGLEQADIEALEAINDDLLAWIDDCEEHAAAFLVDPVGAVERSDIDLPDHLLEKLRRIREAQDGFTGDLAVPTSVHVETSWEAEQ